MFAARAIRPLISSTTVTGIKEAAPVSITRISRMSTTQESKPTYNFEALKVEVPHEYVYHVELNRPNKMNAINNVLWREIPECFKTLGEDPDCRAVVLSGAGKMYCAGIDLMDFSSMGALFQSDEDIARKAKKVRTKVMEFQNTFTAIEKCPKPVITAMHNACIGAGTSLSTACDVRYCTNDTWFSIKEVDMGLAADVGVLQRLSKIVGNESFAREVAFTARNFYADEALKFGYVSRTFATKEEMMLAALENAKFIASKSPVAVQGTKVQLNYARDHTVDESLNFMAHWNMTMLMSEDVLKAVMAAMDKSGPPAQYSKL